MQTGVDRQAWTLLEQGRAADALRLTDPAAALPGAPGPLLMAHAAALKALGRLEEAATANQRAVKATPNDRLAWYNLAATLGDLARPDEALTAIKRAMTLGLDAPEAWLVLGRVEQARHAYDRAEAALAAAIQRRPGFAAAHRDLAQLRWMRTGDLGQALTALDAALAASGVDGGLVVVKALVMEFAGEKAAALTALRAGLAARPGDVPMLLSAAHLAAETGDAAGGRAFAAAALRQAPNHWPALSAMCEALLAVGEAAEAVTLATRMRTLQPLDQSAIALQSTAWRLLGDPRGDQLNDYDLARTYRLPTPAGWPSLDAYLAALKTRLLQMHDLKAHPLQQSLRGGSQVESLQTSSDPLIRAFLVSARQVVADYIRDIGPGTDPLRARSGGEFAVRGAWSVNLRSQGFHADHVHPNGWISSAFYVDVPDAALDETRREGWLRFGEPGCPTVPALVAGRHVQPKPGLLALFPAYMWHGTVPFTSDATRLTLAFDIRPV